jgi:hypothetical protein
MYSGVVPISSMFGVSFRELNDISITDKSVNVISASKNNINGVLTRPAPLFLPTETAPPSITSILRLLSSDFINSSIFCSVESVDPPSAIITLVPFIPD